LKLAQTIALGTAVAFLSPVASARGVSPYLPLSLSPAIERQIERVLILAGKPVMRRPIAAAVVLDALPVACEKDRVACAQVRRYLEGYMKTWGLTSFDVQLATATGDSGLVLPNQHGESVDSSWRASASAYYQPNDHIIVNAGGIAYEGNATPTGSYLSLGFDWAQLDIGFRDHWFSPLTDSSSLISTEAPTMPSVTLSNYEPISPLGISYEVFLAEMSHQDGILFLDSTTSGRPRLAGQQLSFEPAMGYALSVSRITQYGGGARNGGLFSQFFDALFKSNQDWFVEGQPNELGNREASLASSLLFPGKIPFAVRIEYAGEDNGFDSSLRFGATNTSVGLDFPSLGRAFDLTYEISEWQDVWYIHHLYPKGMTNEGRVLGHWFGDNRVFGDALGGRSHMLRAGWRLPTGNYLQARYRNLRLDERWAFTDPHRPYETLHMFELDYTHIWQGHAIDLALLVGQDVFGDSFARIAAGFDFARRGSMGGAADLEPEPGSSTEIFIDAGSQYSKASERVYLENQRNLTSEREANYHVGLGVRRRVAERHDIGARVELDDVAGHQLMSLRAVDYRYRLNRKLALGGFIGVGRYDLKLPAYGYYFGVGLQYLDVLPRWDIGLDYRTYDKLTRFKGLPSDPESNPGLNRRVIDIDGVSLYVSKRW